MRKIFTLLIALLALTVSSWAQFSFEVDDFWYYANGNGTATLINNQDEDAQGVYSLSGEITIPGTIENYETSYSVDGIDGSAFRNCSGITSVTIEEGVTFIKYNAFEGCSSLATIILPSTIEDLYVQAFSGSGITTIIINATNPSNVHLLEGDPFLGLENLHIYVPAESVAAYKAAAGWSDHASIIEAIPAAPAVVSEVTWDSEDMKDLDLREYTHIWSSYQEKYIDYNDGEKVAERKDVVATISGSAYGAYAQFSTSDNNTTISLSDGGTLTFSSATRQFESIVINYTGEYGNVNDDPYNPTGWNDDTQNVISWSGSATNSVVLESAYVPHITSIVFTFAASADQDPSSTHDPVTWNSEYISSLALEDPSVYHPGTTTANHEGVVVTIAAPDEEGAEAKWFTSAGDTQIWLKKGATLEFSTGLGQFESIVIQINPDYQYDYYLAGWYWDREAKQLIWPNPNEDSEASSSVILDSSDEQYGIFIYEMTSIVFTFANTGGDEPGDQPGDEPGDDPVVENKTATSVVIEGGNYYQGQFTLMDNDCGSLSAFGNPNVYLRVTELLNTISDMPLTITSSNESVVVASLTDYTDGDDHIYRSINFEQRDYGHAVITVSFAGNGDYASSQASFDYYHIMNTDPMAACHVQDSESTMRTRLVMTEGDKIALDFVRDDGDDVCYSYVGTATTTYKSCWKYDEEISRRVFYPHAAGLDTIVYEYFRSNRFDEQVQNKEDFKYWPHRQTIKIPVEIHPFLTPMAAVAQTKMNLNPVANASMAFSNTTSDLYNPTEEQLEINSTVTAENLQVALDSMGTGTPEWNEILPGATTFNVNAGKGKIKIECQTVDGYELKVLVRDHGTATITQPEMGIAEVEYDVDEITAVLVYLWPTGGSPAPARRAPAVTKNTTPNAIIKSINIIPSYPITAKEDPDPANAGVYYSTFFDSEKKYQLPAGAEAYVAELNAGDLKLTKIAGAEQVIPEHTAIILKSSSSSVELIATDATPVSFSATNSLEGTDEPMAAPANSYVLSGHSTDNTVTGVGFYQFSGTIPAHKAYLTYGGALAPQRMRFIFNNELIATGVENVQGDNVRCTKVMVNGVLYLMYNGTMYNVQGQIVK